jgi:hypothetical protein
MQIFIIMLNLVAPFREAKFCDVRSRLMSRAAPRVEEPGDHCNLVNASFRKENECLVRIGSVTPSGKIFGNIFYGRTVVRNIQWKSCDVCGWIVARSFPCNDIFSN